MDVFGRKHATFIVSQNARGKYELKLTRNKSNFNLIPLFSFYLFFVEPERGRDAAATKKSLKENTFKYRQNWIDKDIVEGD